MPDGVTFLPGGTFSPGRVVDTVLPARVAEEEMPTR